MLVRHIETNDATSNCGLPGPKRQDGQYTPRLTLGALDHQLFKEKT
jgi:hypothetical protein